MTAVLISDRQWRFLWSKRFIVFVSIFIANWLAPAASANEPPICADFGHFLMSQTWPPSECMREPDHNKCASMGNAARWVVHGLWPDDKTPGKYPSFCKAQAYSEEAIANIIPDLHRKWPNLIFDPKGENASNQDVLTDAMLWIHEWEKHGTCAVLCDKTITSQNDYFRLALGLSTAFDIAGMLNAAGIIPGTGKEISGQDVTNAVSAQTGAIPSMACYLDTSTNMSYLLEVRICVTAGTHNVMDCPASGVSEFACPAEFFYPDKP